MPSEEEQEVRKQTAREIVLGWLEFSLLRHYAVDLHPMTVERTGDVVLRLTLRVGNGEIVKRLWEQQKRNNHNKVGYSHG